MIFDNEQYNVLPKLEVNPHELAQNLDCNHFVLQEIILGCTETDTGTGTENGKIFKF